MEFAGRGRRKKLIRALETGRGDRHGRPTCSECTEKLKRERGCNKPGNSYELGGRPFRYTSPALNEGGSDGDHILYECPVGFILRDAPHIYEVIDVLSMAENATLGEYNRQSRYFQQAYRLYRAELARLDELRRHNANVRRDSQYGADLLKAQ